MKIFLIRHGATEGNLKKAFIGVTDQEVCEGGIKELAEIKPTWINLIGDNPQYVYVSPLKRCVQTAMFIFPDSQQILVDDFRECDFGILEGKCHDELMSDERYVKFIEEENPDTFPKGESITDFMERVANKFEELVTAALQKETTDNDAEINNAEKVVNEEKNEGKEVVEGKEINEGKEKNEGKIVIVAHGGTMMGILGHFYEKKDEVPYYKWTPDNGHGYICVAEIEDNKLVLKNVMPI